MFRLNEGFFMHRYEDLIDLFKNCFFDTYNTLLIKGEDEPLYLPATNEQSHNLIFFARGFFASALHECSHWMIAGEHRRTLVDFGYWYVPDGRNNEEQALFQKVEVKPQAIEWIFSQACGYRFRTSIDNLNGSESDTRAFQEAVYHQVLQYCKEGLSERASCFRNALCQFYGTDPVLKSEDFDLRSLTDF